MIDRFIRWLDAFWERFERITPDDQAKIDAWVEERRLHDANLTFTPEAEQDIGNDDPGPPVDHQSPTVDPQREAHLPGPWRGRHAKPDDGRRRAVFPPGWETEADDLDRSLGGDSHAVTS